MKSSHAARSLSDFQMKSLQILTHLLAHDAVSEEVVETLRLLELDYFSLQEKNHLLEARINIDEKTKLLKFKHDYLTTIIKTASRVFYGMKTFHYPISLVRFDIDDFSRFNNKYGHDVGDRVLITVADIILSNSRPTDYPIRFGGEEFDVILPSTDIPGAVVYVKKIFEKLKTARIQAREELVTPTISAGISRMIYDFGNRFVLDSEIEECYGRLQKEADDALYEAKSTGKDRFSIFSQDKSADYKKIRDSYLKL